MVVLLKPLRPGLEAKIPEGLFAIVGVVPGRPISWGLEIDGRASYVLCGQKQEEPLKVDIVHTMTLALYFILF